MVFRDHDGKILLVGVRRIKARWPVEVSEAAAALFGLQVAARNNFELVHMEGDSLNVISAVSNKLEGSSPIHLLFYHILLLIKSIPGFFLIVVLLRDMTIR